MESDGFTLVKHKRKRRTKYKTANSRSFLDGSDYCGARIIDIKYIIEQVTVEDTVFCDKIISVISENHIEEILCYGIGRLGSCKLAQFQLATLVCLMRSSPGITRAYLFDPVLTRAERALVSGYMEVLPGNDMCCRRVTCNTLFFMIHSSKRMYDNVLKSNWDQLDKCTIMGNSFQSYLVNTSNQCLVKQVPHIFHSTPRSTERELPEFSSYDNVFNDTVITEFSSSLEGPIFPVDLSEDGLEILEGDSFDKTGIQG